MEDDALARGLYVFLAIIVTMTVAVIVATLTLGTFLGRKIATNGLKKSKLRLLPPVLGAVFAILELLAWGFFDLSGIFGAEITVLILIVLNIAFTGMLYRLLNKKYR